MTTQAATTQCGTHGTRTAAVVCGHIVAGTDRVVGFVENSADPDDLQAWCEACERMFLEEEDMTERFKKFNDMAVVCDACYVGLRERHSAAGSGEPPKALH